MRRIGSIFSAFVAVALLASSSAIFAAADPATLPEGWRELPHDKLVAAASKVLTSNPPPSREVIDTINSHAAQRLRDLGPNATIDYWSLVRLYAWGHAKMASQEQKLVVSRLNRPTGDFSKWPYSRLFGGFLSMAQAQVPYPTLLSFVVAWLDDYDVSKVDKAEQLAWIAGKLEHANRFLPAAERPPAEKLEAFRTHVAAKLADLPANADLAYDQRVLLFDWARSKMTPEQQAREEELLAGMTIGEASVADWDFGRLQLACHRMRTASVREEARQSLIVAWARSHDFSSLPDVRQVIWLCEEVCEPGIKSRQFTVRWNGFVTAPADGKYTFSTSPINVNSEHRTGYTRASIAVWVGGKQVLDSKLNGWTWRGTEVEMVAGKATPIRVEFSYVHYLVGSNTHGLAHAPAIAKLMWETAGMSRTVVPESAFSLPQGDGKGLEAEYHLTADGEEKTVTRVESTIDHEWFGVYPVVAKYPDLRKKAMDLFFEHALDPQVAATCESERVVRNKHPLWLAPNYVMLLTPSQKAALATELLARPALFAYDPQPMAFRFYWGCRLAAPEESLELLSMYPDIEPVFDTQFEGKNRTPFVGVVQCVVWQCRPHLDILEQQHLETPGGGCCLSVAYIVAHCHLVEGRMAEWIEKLDGRLADPSLTGDRRVNWLLARAHAEEIRHGRAGRHFKAEHRLLAGRQWLEEALLVAKSEPVRLRAQKELATRLAAYGRLDQARQVVDDATQQVSEASSVAALSTWQQEIDKMQTAIEQQREQEMARSEQLYLDKLRGRRQRALDAANTEAASHYEQLLTAAGATIE